MQQIEERKPEGQRPEAARGILVIVSSVLRCPAPRCLASFGLARVTPLPRRAEPPFSAPNDARTRAK
jgi:hypothetical protein